MNTKEKFRAQLDSIKEVPTLPNIAFKAIALITDEKSSAREIGMIIQEDPPIAAKVVSLANSGYYCIRNPVTNIQQCIVLLGLEEIKNLIFTIGIFSAFSDFKSDNNFDYLKFWKHSTATAKVGSVLADYLKIKSKYEIYLGGLLHDFGRLVLQLFFQDEYKKVFEFCIQENVNLYEAEKQIMGFCHDDAGYWLAQKWNLPESLATIVRNHHQLSQKDVEHDLSTSLIHVSDNISNIWGLSVEPLPVIELLEFNPIWQKMLEIFSPLKDLPLEEMTRVFDMQLQEAELFVEKLLSFQEIKEKSA